MEQSAPYITNISGVDLRNPKEERILWINEN